MPWVVPIVALASAAYGVYSSERAKSKARKQEAAMEAELRARPSYQKSASAQSILDDTRSRIDAVSPGVLAGRQVAQQQAAAQAGAAQRYASSGAEAISASAAAQARLNSLAPSLTAQQDQYKDQALRNYYAGLGGMTEEDRLMSQDRLTAHSDRINYALGRLGAYNASKAQGQQMAMGALMSGAGYMANRVGTGSSTVNVAPQQEYIPELQGTRFQYNPGYTYNPNGLYNANPYPMPAWN